MKNVKKLLALCLVAVMLFAFAACGDTDKKESKKDKDSSGVSDKLPGVNLSSDIEIGEVINVANKATFYVDFCQITKRVNPPKTNGAYSYYAADEGKVYIDICLGFKNLGTESVNVSDLFDCEIVYDKAYKYSTFEVAEEDSRGDLTAYRNLTPLSQEYVHILSQVPSEVEASSKPLSAVINYNGSEYTFDIRNNITGQVSANQTSTQPSSEPDPVPQTTQEPATTEEATTAAKPSAPATNANELTDKQVVTIDGKCEFFVDFAKIEKEVRPPHPNGAYTYYPAESGKSYVDLCISYKNLDTYAKEVRDITDVTLVYAGNYKYTGFITAEEDSRGDFSTFVEFGPLTTEYMHLIVQVPEIVQTSSESVELFFDIEGTEYCYKLR